MRTLSILTIIAYFSLVGFAYAQEHPEHPSKTKTKQEHPKAEHPEHPTATKAISTADLESKIREIIDQKSKDTGSLRLDDPVTKAVWMLKLDKVHTDRLTQLDPATYFACVDMIASNGRKVDVDFFLKDRGGKLEMTDMTVHKIDGVARYNWAEQCYWKRVEI